MGHNPTWWLDVSENVAYPPLDAIFREEHGDEASNFGFSEKPT